MSLDEAQKSKVSEWVQRGLQPAEVQKRISEEFGLTLTYMEIRFLMAELDVKPVDREVEEPRKESQPPAPPPSDGGESADPGTVHQSVSLTVDQLTRPGSLVSGKVTFSDGQTAEWYLDQMGRLGLSPAQRGYKPSQDDLMQFQVALQNELARMGY